MLGRISVVRHAVVLGAIGVTTTLTALGVMATSKVTDDAWQVAVQPANGDSGLRVTYVVDANFHTNKRHGVESFIPHDFGVPTDFVVSSPDAPDQFSLDQMVNADAWVTRLRVGAPDQKVSGQHRYEISYTYPDALLSNGVLSVDLASGVPYEIDSFDATVSGFELNNPTCYTGATETKNECEVTATDAGYQIHLDHLAAGDGVSFDGDIVRRVPPSEFVPNPPPPRHADGRAGVTAAMALLGLLGAVPVFVYARRVGRNEVYAGGAATAAFGDLPPPNESNLSNSSKSNSLPTRLVPDSAMPTLATTEFVPPKGLAPWEGQVLLAERFDERPVEAWFSGLAGADIITVAQDKMNLVIGSGPDRAKLGPPDRGLLERILASSDPYVTGKYDPNFAATWSAIAASQRNRLAASGWWKRFPPGARFGSSGEFNLPGLTSLVPLAVFMLFSIVSVGASAVGLFASPLLAFAVGMVFPAVVAYFMYRQLLPARSAAGSALALQTESFRRFLHASEGQHVEWAYSKGLLREYSGWAVALGEADAWSSALSRANVPEPARMQATPLFIHTWFPSMSATRTAPSQSGGSSGRFGGSGGGFRGGSVGGGGGGFSGGSW